MIFTYVLLAVAALQLLVLAAEVVFVYATQGFAYGLSSNRVPVTRTGLGLRVRNVLQNQVETNSYAIPVLAVAAMVNLTSSIAELAAIVHIACRVAFAIFYYTGLPFLRVPFWLVGWLSIVGIGVEVVRLLGAL